MITIKSETISLAEVINIINNKNKENYENLGGDKIYSYKIGEVKK